MAFNLKDAALEIDVAFIHLTKPDGTPLMTDDGKKVGVNVYSPSTTQARNAWRAWMKYAAKPESQEKDDAKIKYLCAITQSWENIEFDGLSGAELTKKIYSYDKLMPIHQQIYEECTKFKHFLTSSTSS